MGNVGNIRNMEVTGEKKATAGDRKDSAIGYHDTKVKGDRLIGVKVSGIIGHMEGGSKVKQPGGGRDTYRGGGGRLRGRGVRGIRMEQ